MNGWTCKQVYEVIDASYATHKIEADSIADAEAKYYRMMHARKLRPPSGSVLSASLHSSVWFEEKEETGL